MTTDPFGNLSNWGLVLEQLQRLRDKGELDGVQPGLIRLIRYPANWQLRHGGLNAARKVAHPSADLVDTISEILGDPGIYTDTRILAASTLADLAQTKTMARASAEESRVKLLALFADVLCSPESPILHRAVEEAEKKVKASQKARKPKPTAEVSSAKEISK